MKQIKMADTFQLKELEILVITNHGDFVMEYNELDKFEEANTVSYGEEGNYFEVLMIITPSNQKYIGDSMSVFRH